MGIATIVLIAGSALLLFYLIGSSASMDMQTAQEIAAGANYQGIPQSLVQSFAQGIAQAEGFGIAGAIPTVTNNPGDLEIGDIGNGTNGGKTIFATVAQGWTALYNQVALMFSGNSAYYSPSMTIAEVAATYTGNDNSSGWANTVAAAVGASASTQLGSLLT